MTVIVARLTITIPQARLTAASEQSLERFLALASLFVGKYF